MFLCCTNVFLVIFKNCFFLLCRFLCLTLCVQTGVYMPSETRRCCLRPWNWSSRILWTAWDKSGSWNVPWKRNKYSSLMNHLSSPRIMFFWFEFLKAFLTLCLPECVVLFYPPGSLLAPLNAWTTFPLLEEWHSGYGSFRARHTSQMYSIGFYFRTISIFSQYIKPIKKNLWVCVLLWYWMPSTRQVNSFHNDYDN